MARQSPDYEQLFLEERRKREEAEHAREQNEEKIRKTTLPEFLDASHVHLYSGLIVQTDATLSTQGDPSNAKNKVCPEWIQVWEDFSAAGGNLERSHWITLHVGTPFQPTARYGSGRGDCSPENA